MSLWWTVPLRQPIAMLRLRPERGLFPRRDAGSPDTQQDHLNIMYAIIRAGGKQAKVHEGDVLDVERIKKTDTVSFTPLLIVSDDGTVISDKDVLGKATVTAEVVGPSAGPKVDIFKYKAKTGYRRRQGHRQKYTTIKVTKIDAAGTASKPAKAAKASADTTEAKATTAKASKPAKAAKASADTTEAKATTAKASKPAKPPTAKATAAPDEVKAEDAKATPKKAAAEKPAAKKASTPKAAKQANDTTAEE